MSQHVDLRGPTSGGSVAWRVLVGRGMPYRSEQATVERHVLDLERELAHLRRLVSRARRLGRRRAFRRATTAFAVVFGTVVFVAGVLVVTAVEPFAPPSVHAASSTTRFNARMLHPIAEKWWLDHGTCPTWQKLVEEKEISRASSPLDAYGVPFVIGCIANGEVVVTSAGPDHAFGTPDDIVVP